MAHSDDCILVFTDTIRHEREEIAAAVHGADASPVVSTDPTEAVTILRSQDLRAVVADVAAPGLNAVLKTLRAEPRLHSLPIIVVVPDASSDAFDEAHGLGADGVVAAGNRDELTRCLAALLEGPRVDRVPEVHGTVLVAHPDASQRRALARGLRRVGFGVSFAADPSDLDERVDSGGPCALLIGSALDCPSEDVIRLSESHSLPTIVLADAHELSFFSDAARGHSRIAVAPTTSGAAALVFRLGELLRPGLANVRSSQRILSPTLCYYREAGTPRARHGMSHNISLDGMYIRAMAPPARGTQLWLELVPPGCDKLVHLRAEAMWNRGPWPTAGGGPTPPGFGVRLIAEACTQTDLRQYQAAYEALARKCGSGLADAA